MGISTNSYRSSTEEYRQSSKKFPIATQGVVPLQISSNVSAMVGLPKHPQILFNILSIHLTCSLRALEGR